MTEQQRQYVQQLEQAVLEADSAMTDWQAAQRKGCIPDAQLIVFNAADRIRRMRKESLRPKRSHP